MNSGDENKRPQSGFDSFRFASFAGGNLAPVALICFFVRTNLIKNRNGGRGRGKTSARTTNAVLVLFFRSVCSMRIECGFAAPKTDIRSETATTRWKTLGCAGDWRRLIAPKFRSRASENPLKWRPPSDEANGVEEHQQPLASSRRRLVVGMRSLLRVKAPSADRNRKQETSERMKDEYYGRNCCFQPRPTHHRHQRGARIRSLTPTAAPSRRPAD